MAEAADLLKSAKRRLDITVITDEFTTVLETFVEDSVKRLYPYAAAEVDEQEVTTFRNDNGEVKINLQTDLATAVLGFRDIEYTTNGDSWHPVEAKTAHGKFLTVRGVPSDATALKIYGLNPYTLETLPEYLELAIVYYTCAEFFNYLIGNKRKYNVYMQASGARTVENMQDMAAYYEQKADTYVADRATIYGY